MSPNPLVRQPTARHPTVRRSANAARRIGCIPHAAPNGAAPEHGAGRRVGQPGGQGIAGMPMAAHSRRGTEADWIRSRWSKRNSKFLKFTEPVRTSQIFKPMSAGCRAE